MPREVARTAVLSFMNLATFETLLSPIGQTALAAALRLNPSEETFLTCCTRMQKHFTLELSKAAIETVIVRKKASGKFSRAAEMYFTREALEQSSGEIISRYRAERFAEFAAIGDWCCGIGGDTIALAAQHHVVAAEIDPLRIKMAEANLKAYGVHAGVNFINADVTQLALPQFDALFFDPARRVNGRRRFSVEEYQPPLARTKEWLPHVNALGVKISPAVNTHELARYDCEIEFVSVAGELKECVLWFGAAKAATCRATLLPERHTLTPVQAESRIAPPRAYLYEPDAAVLRAGLVTTLAAQLDAHQIDRDIAYLTSDKLLTTPFARAFAIEAAFPFHLKKLREYLRALQVGRVTVKKRGSPIEPETLMAQLKLSGSESRIVFLTHVEGKPFVLIGSEAS